MSESCKSDEAGNQGKPRGKGIISGLLGALWAGSGIVDKLMDHARYELGINQVNAALARLEKAVRLVILVGVLLSLVLVAQIVLLIVLIAKLPS